MLSKSLLLPTESRWVYGSKQLVVESYTLTKFTFSSGGHIFMHRLEENVASDVPPSSESAPFMNSVDGACVPHIAGWI